MAYQSEIELRVRVIDKELKELEERIQKVTNPYDIGGRSKVAADKQRKERLQIEKEISDAQIAAAERLEKRRLKSFQTAMRRIAFQKRERLKQEREVARQRQKLNENLALGVGFPLLFGGGAGAVAGGALGAVAGSKLGDGGGFGLQILFSDLGQQIDSFLTGVQEYALTVATALDGTSSSLEAVKEAGIVVRDSTIEYVQQLEDSGRSLDAYNAVQRELNNIYGTEGVTVLQELKGANEFANTEAGKLGAVLQTELAPAFILLAQLGGGAARALREVVPAIADAIGEFTLGIPGATTTTQLSKRPPGTDPAKVAAGARQREAELRTDAEIRGITAGTEALRRQTEIAQLNNDLTDDRVVALRRAQIEIEAQNKISELSKQITEDIFNENLKRLNLSKIEKVRQQETLDLAKLEASARKAVTAETERAAAAQERAAKAAQRAAEKAERARMKELQDRINIAARERQKELDLEANFQKRITAIGNETALLRGQINGNEELVRKQIEINGLVAQFGEEKRGQIEMFVNEKFQVAEQNRLLQEQKQIFGQIGQTIETGVVGLIEAAVDRTKSLGEVASNILRNLARQLLSLGVNQLFGGLGGLFNGGGGGGGGGGLNLAAIDAYMANGGSAKAGGSYIVGERGPELFVPRTSGTVVPNHAMGGASVTVNVDASGSSVQGDGPSANQLGKAIGAAVQAELIKQKRPGGLLTR